MKEYRCPNCNKLLFKANIRNEFFEETESQIIETVCHRCKKEICFLLKVKYKPLFI